ncbi:transposase [Neobacillus niacini]
MQVGIITVIQTFGRDTKFNPHIHVLETKGP